MKTIYKYSIEVEDEQFLKLPFGSRILSTAFQGKDLCLWVLVNKDEEFTSEYKIYVHGTGHPVMDSNANFIGTSFIDNLVFHVFAKIQ